MNKFPKEIADIDLKLTNYKPIIKKYILSFSLTILIIILLFPLLWKTSLKFILLLPFILALGLLISFIIKVINISRNNGYSFFKSITYEFKQKRLSGKLKTSFRYLKYNLLLKCCSFMHTTVIFLMWLLLPILFIYITVSKPFTEFFKNLPEQYINNLFNISTMIFGIVITLFSILVSTKQHKIYDENEHKLVLKYKIWIYNVLELIIDNIIYFVLVIINYVIGSNNALSIIFLIIYGLFAIISLTIVINSSVVKIYYNVNHLSKNNIFQRRKGNFVNFLSEGEKFSDKVEHILKLSLTNSFFEFFKHLEKLRKKVFYSQDEIENFDVELFSKYTIEYFKQIKNDSQIFGLFVYIEEIKKILVLLYEKEKYEFFEHIVYLVNEQLLKFLNSKTMSQRFGILSQEECKMSMYYDQLISSISLRNLMIIETIIPSVISYDELIKDLITKDETKFYKLKNSIYDEMKSKIIFILNSYKSNNDSIDNIINEIMKDFNKMVENIKEKIEQNTSEFKNHI